MPNFHIQQIKMFSFFLSSHFPIFSPRECRYSNFVSKNHRYSSQHHRFISTGGCMVSQSAQSNYTHRPIDHFIVFALLLFHCSLCILPFSRFFTLCSLCGSLPNCHICFRRLSKVKISAHFSTLSKNHLKWTFRIYSNAVDFCYWFWSRC